MINSTDRKLKPFQLLQESFSETVKGPLYLPVLLLVSVPAVISLMMPSTYMVDRDYLLFFLFLSSIVSTFTNAIIILFVDCYLKQWTLDLQSAFHEVSSKRKDLLLFAGLQFIVLSISTSLVLFPGYSVMTLVMMMRMAWKSSLFPTVVMWLATLLILFCLIGFITSRLLFTLYEMLLQDCNVIRGLRSSWQLFNGRWVGGVLAIILAPTNILSILLMIFSTGQSSMGHIIFQTLLTPVQWIYMLKLYDRFRTTANSSSL